MQELVDLLEPFFSSEKGNHRNDVYFIAKEWNEKKGSRVLELGGRNEPLSEMLHQLGYKVTVVDLEPAETCTWLPKRSHKWVVGDFNKVYEKLGKFDVVISCSAIEHFGMPSSAEEHKKTGRVKDNYADVLTMMNIKKILKKNGIIYVTVPIAREFFLADNDWRVYDEFSLYSRVINAFHLEKTVYFFTDMTRGKVELSREQAFDIMDYERRGNACLLRLKK